MKLSEAVEILETHQVWRLGAIDEPTDPRRLTEAIEIVLYYVKQLVKK